MRTQAYRLGYRGDIEGLRALAILLVVAAHAGCVWLRGGFVGVDVFFVLSGYLITGLLLQEIDTTGGVRFLAFYARRLQRLLPALLLMVAGVALAAALLLPPTEQPFQATGAASAAVWLSNMHFAFARLSYFGPSAESNLFLHTWSLGVEEQFYLIWPALLVLVLGARRGKQAVVHSRRLKIAMLVVLAISLAACILFTGTAPQLAFYLMPARAWQFALGALVFLYARRAAAVVDDTLVQTPPSSGAARIAYATGWLGLGAIIAASLWFGPDMPYPGVRAVLPSIGAAAILLAGSWLPAAGVARMLSVRPMQALGRVSYAWYLWHWPVLLLGAQWLERDTPVDRGALVLLSLALAVLSYRFVEAPIRRNPRLVARPGIMALGAVALMVLVNAGCIRWYNAVTHWIHQPQQQRYQAAQFDYPVIYQMGCDEWYRSAQVRVCAFGPAKTAHTVVLMGDSVGAQWFPAVARAFDRPGWRLLVITKSSCPMVDEPMFYPRIGREYTVCSQWRKDALKTVAALKPEVLILGSTSTYDFTRAQWLDGTAKVLNAVAADVGRIDLVRATPDLPFNGPACLAQQSWLHGALAMRHACEAPASSPQNANVYRWLGEVARRYRNVSTIDMNGWVCPGGECKAERDGMIVFRDNQHLTASFVQSLSGDFAKSLQASH